MNQFKQNETSIFEERNDDKMMSAFVWWEKRRLFYNIYVTLAGVFGLVLSFFPMSFLDFVGIVMWMIVANVFYCLGFLVELFVKHYFKSTKAFDNRTRQTLFWLGCIFSMLLTFAVPIYLTMIFWAQD